MQNKLIIFDLDGTLLDTLDDLKNALNHTLSKNGMPTYTRDEVRQMVGNGMKKLMRDAAILGTSDEKLDEMLADFKTYYNEHIADCTKPYDGIVSLLESLKKAGIKTAIVSNKADKSVKILVKKYFGNLIDLAIGENEANGIRKKPSPDMVNLALENFVGCDDIVYVGDSEVDCKTAQNSNLPLVAVSYGFRDRAVLEKNGALKIVDTVEELKKML